MSGRGGGCCIARHAGGGGGGGGGGDGGFIPYGMTKVERIMLKFRPIAPKPAAAGSGSGGSTTENSDGYVKCGRGKRKYVRVNRNNKKKMIKEEDNNKRKVVSSSPPPPPSSGGDTVVTLSLLPETPDRKESSPVTDFPDLLKSCNNCNNNDNNMKRSAPVWLSFNGGVDPVVIETPPPVQRRRVVSQVTVECVTDTWIGVEGLGCTDEERVMKMEVDTCPGFISDGQDRVVWANKAYREMVGVDGGDNMSVVLVRKDKRMAAVPPLTAVTSYPAFTCKVKVSSAVTTSVASPATLTLPCDGWRMKNGGCAWRLDVKAALSLGR